MILSSNPDLLTHEADKHHLAKHKIPIVKSKTLDFYWRFPLYKGFDHETLPAQGFKIHLSATILNCLEVFRVVIPFLLEKEIYFKVVGSFHFLRSLNTNFFGYRQVGKFITVYPLNVNKAIHLIKELEKITDGYQGPRVPSDIRIKTRSIIHYRYGSIRAHSLSRESDEEFSIILPDGSKEKDLRDPAKPIPDWIKDPIRPLFQEKAQAKPLLAGKFICINVLRQRSKGGVYVALDLNPKKKMVREVLIKEARPHSETEPSGVDAKQRLRWQAEIQKKLSLLNISPKIHELIDYQDFTYLVMERFGNHSLHEIIQNLSTSTHPYHTRKKWMQSLTQMLAEIHRLGFYFFDLSPDNVRIDDSNTMRFVDLENIVGPNSPPCADWGSGTRGFFPNPQTLQNNFEHKKALVLRDIYSLGSFVLALYSPVWYKNLLKRKVSFEDDWDQTLFLCEISDDLKKIVKKTRSFSYDKVDDFLIDFEKAT
ncbi:MAG: hypothetical protein S4CHLAM123_15620 [Chlamydiales bacterium]|nr:hypothetical protein [Chlamydiales bacterium]